MEPPKVFVSHASEDKERFVLNFASRLRDNGIDAWVDKWEISVGDSLVKKIFDEGLSSAKAVIIVLSKNSVNKPWVREELDHAVVKKIGDGIRIIPLVLDDCEVPQALKVTKWVSFKEDHDYEDSFDEVVATIFGSSNRPPLGNPPAYTTKLATNGSTNIDDLVKKLACEAALNGGSSLIGESPFKENGLFIIPESQLRDSFEYLTEYGALEWCRDLSGSFHGISVSEAGFELYAREHISGYSDIFRVAVSLIVNSNVSTNTELQTKLGVKPFLADHIIKTLVSSGSIKVNWFLGGRCMIASVSASLKRSLN